MSPEINVNKPGAQNNYHYNQIINKPSQAHSREQSIEAYENEQAGVNMADIDNMRHNEMIEVNDQGRKMSPKAGSINTR